MGSSLSLAVVASSFMEDFSEEAYAIHCWFQYTDIYNMATKAEKLRALLDYLNSRHSNIQFTMDTERERDGHLPFLEINCYRTKDSSLSHQVYRKSTKTNLYMTTRHHHAVNICSVMSALVLKPKVICEQASLLTLQTIFYDDEYNPNETQCALHVPQQIKSLSDHQVTVAFLPFIQLPPALPECYQNIISNWLVCQKLSGQANPSKMTQALICQGCIAHPARMQSIH